MKYIVLTFFILLNSLSVRAHIECNNGKIIVVRGIKHSGGYQEASIQVMDPDLKNFLLTQGPLAGNIWANGYGTSTAIFNDKSDVFVHIQFLSNFEAIVSVNKQGRNECLRWQETCDCCYYGDCSPTCLEEVNTPGVMYIKKTVTCEEK